MLAPELAPLGSVDVTYTAYGNIDEEDFLYYRWWKMPGCVQA